MVLCLVLVLVFLAACSGNNNEPAAENTEPAAENQTQPAEETSQPANEAPADEKKDPVKLQFVWWGPAGDKNWQRMFDAFTAEYPWITVEVLQTADVIQGVGQMVTESIAAGNPIDLFWNNSFDYVVNQDLAEDLTPYIEKDPEFQAWKFKDGYLELFQHEGRQLGLAHGNDAFLIFVNEDLLEQYGLEMPGVDWTWDDFRELAIAATKPDAKHYGVSYSPGTQFFWWSYVNMQIPYVNGSAPTIGYMSEDRKKNLADGSVPEVLDDLNFLYDLMVKDGVMLNAPRAEAAGLAGADTWASGQSLFHIFVSPGIAGYKQSLTFDWDILPMPGGKERQANLAWINPWFMSKGSDNKEEAWLFMKWWETNKDAQKLLYDIGGTFPNTDDPEMIEAFNNTPLYEGLNKEALTKAIEIAAFDPTQSMVGGQEFAAAYNGYGAQVDQEVSAHDFYPPVMQKFNEELAKKFP